jgi:hypothetical protein
MVQKFDGNDPIREGMQIEKPPSIPVGPVGPGPADLPGGDKFGGLSDAEAHKQLSAEEKQLALEQQRLSEHPGPVEDQELEARINTRKETIARLKWQLGMG